MTRAPLTYRVGRGARELIGILHLLLVSLFSACRLTAWALIASTAIRAWDDWAGLVTLVDRVALFDQHLIRAWLLGLTFTLCVLAVFIAAWSISWPSIRDQFSKARHGEVSIP